MPASQAVKYVEEKYLPQADISGITRKYLNVPYANLSSAQRMDIYLPEGSEGPFPVLVFVHGGAFRMGKRGDQQVQHYLTGLAHGFAVVSLDYRLSGEAVFPAGIQDCKAAVRYLRAHAEEYHLDPDRIAAAGRSSGANYVLMMAATSGTNIWNDLSLGNAEYSADIQCAVSWYAPTDFTQMDAMLEQNGLGRFADHHKADSPESEYMGGSLPDLPVEYVEAANPASFISPSLPPVLLQAGRLDPVVPYEQSILFHKKACEVCGEGRTVFEIIEGAKHADPLFETPENIERMWNFIKANV